MLITLIDNGIAAKFLGLLDAASTCMGNHSRGMDFKLDQNLFRVSLATQYWQNVAHNYHAYDI